MAKTELDMRDYGRTLVRRKWWVLGSVAGGVVLALVLNTVTSPVYRATVRIEISRERTRSILTGEELDNPSAHSDNLALYTAAELITNRKLLTRVVNTLHDQGVAIGQGPDALPWWHLFLRGRPATASVAHGEGMDVALSAGTMAAKVEWLVGHINVEPVRDTRLVNINVEHTDPRSAELVANTVADLFVQYQMEQRSAGSTNMVAYLTSQLQEVRQNLQRAEQASAYVKARSDRLSVQTRYEQLQAAANAHNFDLDHLPVQSASLEVLKRQLLESDSELAKARQIYRDRHPRLVQLESENESIRNNIRAEFEKAVESARLEYQAALARERGTGGGSTNASGAAALESEIANNRELYQALLTKLKEAEISSQMHVPLVEVVEPAAATPKPVRPHKALNFLVCLFAGFTVGTGLAFLREYLRRTIRTPQDVDDHLHLPVLGLIPKA